ncbi:Rop guanine nucleotide exchange factor [Striga asiatica]|uniref:Rop guanine nucleotide exchange factor n=1 Tax=Striga asiatica TaxID=4170 RepID=A0A5A7RE56_STRAF|nr:Rop guanine nucleotide exchange factor [Striga asiatica]
MTYNGLETCILNSQSYENESRTSRCMSDSFDEDDLASFSTTTNPFGSFSSLNKDKWAPMAKCLNLNEKQKHYISARFLDIDIMKEKFAKLLLGDDVTGKARSVSAELALSNGGVGILTIFSQLACLQSAQKLSSSPRWISDHSFSNFRMSDSMSNDHKPCTVNLDSIGLLQGVDDNPDPSTTRVPFISTPAWDKVKKKHIRNHGYWQLVLTWGPARVVVDALQNTDRTEDSLDSMVDTEFWYTKVGSEAEVGLSNIDRKRLLHKGKLVYQVFKAAKSINENILAAMPIPAVVKDSLPKSAKASLGEELNKILNAESLPHEEMAWMEKIAGQVNNKSTVQSSWPFAKDSHSELDRFEWLVNRAELLVHQLKIKYPNLPQTFFDVTKIRYGKDLGHSVLGAYSRVLFNLAFRILSRIGDILQDVMSNPNSPAAMSALMGAKISGISDSPMLDRLFINSTVPMAKNG